MNSHAILRLTAVMLVTRLAAPCVSAQPTIDWSTIDCGGGVSSGGTFQVSGTIAQPDAGPSDQGMIGGSYAVFDGFWFARAACPADFNNSGAVSVQDLFDYLAAYFSGDLRADVNHSGSVTVQDLFDYLAMFFAGCP